MNAMLDCFDSALERVYLGRQSQADREQAVFDAELAEVQKEIRALFVEAWAGAVVKFPRYSSIENKIVRKTTLADIVVEALCEGEVLTPVMEAAKPGADAVHCIGTFREAVTDKYVADYAADIAEFRLGRMDEQ